MNPSRRARREFLRTGLAAFGSLSLAELYRLRAQAATPPVAAASGDRTAIILVWARGGMSHLDTLDPKPDAPSEYRGPYIPIATRVPGMQLTELLPRCAGIADKFSLLRSVAHTGGGHPAGSLQVLSGDADAADKLEPRQPDFMTVAHYLRYNPSRRIPNYVGVNPVVRYDNFTIAGPGFLGGSYAPFSVTGDPSAPSFRIPNIGIADEAQQHRLDERVSLQQRFDIFRRELDRTGAVEAMDGFQTQALNLLTRPEAAAAFDLNREPAHVRDRYGRHAWGQQLLMARRLVEAGVEIITTTLDGPLCGRVANWDDHAVNHHVFEALDFRMPYFDQAVSALIEDVYARGLDRKVLVVVTGEFGRTPRISREPSSGGGVASAAAGTVQPGRDHWPRANTMMFAGGGIRTGAVIGATDRRGEDVVQRRVGPHDFLATVYRHLGIDYDRVTIPDFSGRPNMLVQNGSAIDELTT
jgi:uncharacterized protein (DUF1501 family)